MKWLKRLFRWLWKSEPEAAEVIVTPRESTPTEPRPEIPKEPLSMPDEPEISSKVVVSDQVPSSGPSKANETHQTVRTEELPNQSSREGTSEHQAQAAPVRRGIEHERPLNMVRRVTESPRGNERPVLVPRSEPFDATEKSSREAPARTEKLPPMASKTIFTLVETEPEQSETESIPPVAPTVADHLAEFDEDDEFGDLRTHIRRRVAAGLDLDDIEAEALDLFAGDFDAETLKSAAPDIASREMRRHELLEATWSDATDCNRLDEAFRELEYSGIIARQSFACCGTCGAGEIWEEMNVARSAGRAIRGYTFFDTRETQDAVDGRGLRLAYGSVKDGEDEALIVAREVIEVLKRHGLSANWKGNWSARIGLPIDWKKRRPELAEEALVR